MNNGWNTINFTQHPSELNVEPVAMVKWTSLLFLLLLAGCQRPQDPIAAKREAAERLFEVAESTESRGHFKLAVTQLETAAAAYAELAGETHEEGDWVRYIACLNQIGWDYAVYLGSFEDARKVLEIAGQKAATHLSHDHNQSQRQRHNLAVVYYYENRLDEALAINFELLTLRQALPGDHRRKIASTLNNLGLIYRGKGDLNQARIYYERSLKLKLASLGSDHSDLASSYMNLGSIHHLLGEFDSSIDHLIQAYQLRQRTLKPGHPDIAGAAYSLGRVYLDIGDFGSAEPLIEKAIQVQQQAVGEDHPHSAHSLWELARIQVGRGEFEPAILGLKKALVIFKRYFGPNNYHVAENHHYLGWAFWKKGDYEQSLTYLNQALHVLAGGGLNPLDAISIIEETKLRILQAKATVYISQYMAIGDLAHLKASLGAIEEAVRVLTLSRRRIHSQESQLNLAKRSREILDIGVQVSLELYRQTNQTPFLETAFLLSEEGKMAVLRDAIRDVEMQRVAGIPPKNLAKEKAYRQRGYQLDAQAAFQIKNNGGVSEATQAAITEHDLEVESFLKGLEESFPRYFELKYRVAPGDIDSIRASLPNGNTALVAYHLDPSFLTIFVVKKDSISVAQQPLGMSSSEPQEPLVAQDWMIARGNTPNGYGVLLDIEKLRSSMVFEKREVFQYYARRLFDLLLAPIAADIEGDDLILVPDGGLAHLPFEVLLGKDSPVEGDWAMPFLIHDHVLAYAYAASLLNSTTVTAHQREFPQGIAFAPVFEHKKPAKPNSELRVVNQDDNRRVSPLPHSEREVEAIRVIFEKHGGNLAVWTHQQAKLSNFKAALGKGQIIHLATHARMDERFPALSRLLFSGKGDGSKEDALFLGDVFALKMEASLVVLSACETGRGRIATGEGVMGFVRGLHYAGADQVLVSLWQVADDSTADLMIGFYNHYFSGMTTPQALRAAKLASIDAGMPPFAWAGFVLTGNVSPSSKSLN